MRSKRAQAATEYLLIMSLAFVLLIPALQLYHRYSQATKFEVGLTQANQIGRLIVDNSRAIYYHGKNSWVTLDVYMPDNIADVRVEPDGRVLVINASVEQGVTQLVFYSDVQLVPDGSFIPSSVANPGIKHIRVESQGDTVRLHVV